MTGMRSILAITGGDRVGFLQGLVTNDVPALGHDLVYAGLLSPQGKYLFDFFLFQDGETVFLDIAKTASAAFVARLNIYRLRADVSISTSEVVLSRGLGTPPEGAMADPRTPALGWRHYSREGLLPAPVDWQGLYVTNVIPTTGVELISNESYILEMGFERLNGVDFRKGCYVGQEVTARMKHKTELRKGLVRVDLKGAAKPGDEIIANGKKIGTLHSISGNQALAYLRFDHARNGLRVGDAEAIWDGSTARN